MKTDAGVIARHREKIFYAVAAAGVLFLAPFSIGGFLEGRYQLGIATLAAAACFVVYAIAIYRFSRIGERQQQSLRDQMALTRALIDENPNAMYLKDTQGRYVSVNDAWLRMVGLTRERTIGRTVHELFPEEEAARYHAEDGRLLAAGEGASEIELARTGPDGGPQWLIVRKAVLRRADGTLAGLIGTNTDVTRLKQYEADVAERAKFISELLDALPISVAMRDTDGRYLLVNRMWERYFGVKREQALGRRRRDLPGRQGDPERARDADEVEWLDREVLARGPNYVGEARKQMRLGRYYLISRRVLADSAGKALGVVSAGIDATDRHQMEEMLLIEQRRLDLVVRAAQVAIVDWDGRTHATFYSPRFREILGYPRDADTSGWPDYFRALIHPEDRERVTARWRSFIMGKGPEGAAGELYAPEEYRLLRADGSPVWVQTSGVAVRDDKGFVTRWIAAVTDITGRRAQEEALRQSVRLREEVERMSRHDLKTPLASVIAMSRLLREGNRIAAEDAELLGTIERAGYRILNMVNLSLDLFRMESGTYQFNPRAVDLAGVARRVAADLEAQAASKNINIQIKSKDQPVARADELLCYSMFANLVKNAIEAAPERSTVSILLERQDDWVVARVHNLGEVPEAIRARFFEKYTTAGKSAGLGLGSYSAQLMARVQEGELSLHTFEGLGTSLIVRLKAAAGGEAPAAEEETREEAATLERARVTLPPLRVLVVDDDEFNRLVLRRSLPTPPLTLAMAVNGRAALEAAERDWPDAVLLDLEMPVMDGYETARRLREMEGEAGRKRCLIVAISSNDDPATMDRALAAGCDEYIVKPAPRETLWQMLGANGSYFSAQKLPGKEREAKPLDPVVVDPDLRSTLAKFLKSRREMLEGMKPALGRGDRAEFGRLAHKLAGGFLAYGFAWAAAQAKALERDAEQGAPAELLARAAALRAHLDGVQIKFTDTEKSR